MTCQLPDICVLTGLVEKKLQNREKVHTWRQTNKIPEGGRRGQYPIREMTKL